MARVLARPDRPDDPGVAAPPKASPFDQGTDEPVAAPSTLHLWHVLVALAVLLAAAIVSVLVGPADLSPRLVLEILANHLPFVAIHGASNPTAVAVVWQLRLPRIVLGALVGSTLAVSGASYQGVFHNPLADPYLLGVASGAGLGATVAVVAIPHLASWPVSPVPICAFAGAVLAVGATFALGRSVRGARSATSLILAGVAIGAFFVAAQTFLLQQQNPQVLSEVYNWILGGLAAAGWSQVALVAPYVGAAMVTLFALRRLLDTLSVGDDEASSLGVRAERVRLLVIAAATLGTAAVVSVSGLIGFVGIIVPHTVRLTAGPSYQRVIPLSILYGAAFLILADLLARSVLAPGEIPLGVVTAFLGAPFFIIVLRQSRSLS